MEFRVVTNQSFESC